MIGEKDDKPSDDELKRRDSWRGIFMPVGTVLAARVDDRHWLTAGCGEYVPVIYTGETVLMTPPSVQTRRPFLPMMIAVPVSWHMGRMPPAAIFAFFSRS